VRFLVVLVVGAGCGGAESKPPLQRVDCRLIAESLTTLELGNYAPREERAAREQALRLECERANLTKDDGACITQATSKDDVAWCPKPLITPSRVGEVAPTSLLPAVCAAYVRTLERFARCSKLPPDSARALHQQIAQLRAMYTEYAATAPASMLQSCQMANDATTRAMDQTGC
jgi:hypothetical protein